VEPVQGNGVWEYASTGWRGDCVRGGVPVYAQLIHSGKAGIFHCAFANFLKIDLTPNKKKQ
jgi:hypothetical protein